VMRLEQLGHIPRWAGRYFCRRVMSGPLRA
jgi:hypothetical protein